MDGFGQKLVLLRRLAKQTPDQKKSSPWHFVPSLLMVTAWHVVVFVIWFVIQCSIQSLPQSAADVVLAVIPPCDTQPGLANVRMAKSLQAS